MNDTPTTDRETDVSLIETLQSLLIAFILAFTFRAFVVEAFVIPTGSMAPTLLGAHAMVTGPDTGYIHTVGPSDEDSRIGVGGQAPSRLGTRNAYNVSDPMLNHPRAEQVRIANARTRMGDRILVLKYLYSIFSPARFDVVVFKNPTSPTENYIKRLVGLPDEFVWLADGDVFAKSVKDAAALFGIQRKPMHVQRAVWQPVYHSDFIPVDPNRITPRWNPPWTAQGTDWNLNNTRVYSTESAQPSAIVYQFNANPIDDDTAYNQTRGREVPIYPVSDIRLAGAVRPQNDGLQTTIALACRGHEFEAHIADGTVTLRMRADQSNQPWTELASVSISKFAPADEITQLEFWHVDQALYLWINGHLVAQGTYDWTPEQRLEYATGLSIERARNIRAGNPYLAYEHPPTPAKLEWRFQGSALALHRVELDRDLYYRPDIMRDSGEPALATLEPLQLGPDQFFVCGDNNPASLDGRLWGDPNPWIADRIDPAPGVVNRALMLGKAFFVYFPSPEGLRDNARRFVPNFGQMRFIH